MTASSPHLVCLGWERPAVELVAERLLRLNEENPELFRRSIVVVPTRESSRSLREVLAEKSANRAILIPRIILPTQILPLDPSSTATDIEQYSSWFCELDPEQVHEQYPALFPTRPATEFNPDWQFSVAEQLQQLRFRLDNYLITPDAIISRLTGPLASQIGQDVAAEEAARWASINTLFSLVDTRLGQHGKVSRAEAIRRALSSLRWPGSSRLMILACLPQLLPYLQEAVTVLSQQDGGRIEAWVHAPEDFAAFFSPWGIPTEDWTRRIIPLEEDRIHVTAHEEALAKCAVKQVACAANAGHSVTLGVCDTQFTPSLEQAFSQQNWTLYDPSERSVRATDLALLPRQLLEAARPPEKASALDALMRNQVMLRIMNVQQPVSCCLLLDDVAQTHFPETARAMEDTFVRLHQQSPDKYAGTLDYLKKVRRLVKDIAGTGSLPSALNQVADLLVTSFTEDGHYSQCARELAAILTSMADFQAGKQETLAFDTSLSLISRLFDQTAIQAPDDRSDSAIDALGWLELPYARGSHLVLTGMHEDCVPERSGSDPFLPDSLCKAMGLEHAASRLARDSFLFLALLASHRDTDIIVARNTPDRTPITPSKLLLRCGDSPPERLSDRVRHLFISMNAAEQCPPYDRGDWFLHAPGQDAPPARADSPQPNPYEPLESLSLITSHVRNKWTNTKEPLSPSTLKSFLANPLRFWLEHEFDLSPWDAYTDHKISTDPLDTGNLVHEILRLLTTAFPTWRDGLTAEEVESAARQLTEEVILRQFGSTPPLSVSVLKSQLADSLSEFAYLHFEDLCAGWTVLDTERAGSLELSPGITIQMRIDRIDRHKDGTMRVIDYKTHTHSPKDKHLAIVAHPELYRYLMGGLPLLMDAKKPKRWIDVQLPLYGEFVRRLYSCSEDVELAYYNIPVTSNPVAFKPFVMSPDMWQSALETARMVALMIKRGLCLIPTEPFSNSNDETFGGLAPERDLRCMLNLPPLPAAPPSASR